MSSAVLEKELIKVFTTKKFYQAKELKKGGITYESITDYLRATLGNQMWVVLVMNAKLNLSSRTQDEKRSKTFSVDDAHLTAWLTNLIAQLQMLMTDKDNKRKAVQLLKITEEDPAPWWHDTKKVKELLNKRLSGKVLLPDEGTQADVKNLVPDEGTQADVKVLLPNEDTQADEEVQEELSEKEFTGAEKIACLAEIEDYKKKQIRSKTKNGEHTNAVSREALLGEQFRAKCILKKRKASSGDGSPMISFDIRTRMLELQLLEECEKELFRERISEKIEAYKYVIFASHLNLSK